MTGKVIRIVGMVATGLGAIATAVGEHLVFNDQMKKLPERMIKEVGNEAVKVFKKGKGIV